MKRESEIRTSTPLGASWRQRVIQRVPPRVRGLARYASSLGLVLTGVLIAFIALFLFSAFVPGQKPLNENDVNALVASAMASATPPPPLGAVVYDQILPSMVQIRTRVVNADGKAEGVGGTGVLISDTGEILTALHVVDKALEIQVMFADGTESTASLVGQQADQDIAVLRAKDLPSVAVPAVMGNPGALQVGEPVVAVGNPFGITNSLTQGVVSGLNRNFKPPNQSKAMTGLIQFDAAINPGNSGGPLLNSAGEVVGIVSGLVNPTDQDVFIGIGFAVPINSAASAAGSPPY